MWRITLITFYKLEYYIKKNHIKKYQISRATGISSRTLSNMSANKSITMETLNKLCNYLKCKPEDIMEYTSEEDLKK